VVALCLAGAVIGTVAFIRGGDGGDDDGVVVAPTGAPATTDVTADPSASAPGASSTLAPTTTLAPLVPLPVVDLDAGCRAAFGDDAVLAVAPTGEPQCVSAAGTSDIDVSDVCVAQQGTGARAVRIAPTPSADAWRCTSTARRPVGPPDWDLACRKTLGERAQAVLVVDDERGWRCASIVEEVFAVTEITLDSACQTVYGIDTFGEPSGTTADANQCYGVVA
jgi:hypothetical protein